MAPPGWSTPWSEGISGSDGPRAHDRRHWLTSAARSTMTSTPGTECWPPAALAPSAGCTTRCVMSNKVLITYASRHGSTEGIAERIAVALRARAIDTDVAAVQDVRDPDGYDGYVLGSAVYAGSWLGSMKAFIHRHRATLRRHPVWLFSSGPLSTDPS